METSTRNEPNDPFAHPLPQSASIQAKARATVRCRLCREAIVLESNFRPTPATCPHCGLKFVFDPQQEPLPVRGLRLRWSAVREAQRRPGTAQHVRHEAHLRAPIQVSQPKTNYLAWAGGLALSLAVAMTFFGGWFHRFLGR